eukprot:CAMPEP_0206565770 /NCGR_PEP_ID=MMETSP0325_2-20121206/24270_1 /ASSEMBLY_ACC=CAM_ASM_000347 /TAXON_ID=2866 /ORGANISM="Crypthecodinium cohnii, Strain Seligo" /LENGTH=315 /DNA_ID=CAMNT_0054068691 /DNA_START=91 /DNA_END=1035 /DNA_ORIENTATION=-
MAMARWHLSSRATFRSSTSRTSFQVLLLQRALPLAVATPAPVSSALAFGGFRSRPLPPTPQSSTRFRGFASTAAKKKKKLHVSIGCDASGETLKGQLAEHLRSRGLTVNDVGSDDFFRVAAAVARDLQKYKDGRGILVSSSGPACAMMANKFKGVYAYVADNSDAAAHGVVLHGMNCLALDCKQGDATGISDGFLDAEFATAPAERPSWCSDEALEAAHQHKEEVGKNEMRALDEGVQDYLNAANAMADRMRGFGAPDDAGPYSPGPGAPPTPPTPPSMRMASPGYGTPNTPDATIDANGQSWLRLPQHPRRHHR